MNSDKIGILVSSEQNMRTAHEVDADSNTDDSELEEFSPLSHIELSENELIWGFSLFEVGNQPGNVRIDSLLCEDSDVQRLLPVMLSPPLKSPIRSVCPDRKHR